MKKLLVVIVLILIATYAYAGKVVTDQGCTGSDLDRECTKRVVCDQDPCAVLFVDSNNATCSPAENDPGAGVTVDMVANNDGADPSCSWLVTEGDNDPDAIPVDIDSTDSLPVEIESFSVE